MWKTVVIDVANEEQFLLLAYMMPQTLEDVRYIRKKKTH